ncbi:nucleoside 2-deoxyribosyltransferase [Neisseria sp. 83E34]|uniref:nucleoside 2-deoxyribosyltransferase n=1 Tax=Neisseria sp. 83E34 TaxID=1692264 RepID=UPI0006CE8EAE|nr:nucleoside 2-deoxyribosyltransferase [Neisseria sp. 83E34]
MREWQIYCAGGDVFLPEPKRGQVFDNMKKLAEDFSDRHGSFRLLIPLDNEVVLQPGDSVEVKRANALTIRLANEEMIRRCDVVIANLSPFRGEEPDCGTTYECGFARALGKPVLAYTDNPAEQTAKYAGFDFDREAEDSRFAYAEVEDFALPFNLMLYDADTPVFASFADALRFYVAWNGKF